MKRSINKLTQGANLLWESSRMMLPEHKEKFLEYRHNLRRKVRPHLDEQQQERIFLTLMQSMQSRKEIIVAVFSEWGDKQLRGVVTKIDPQLPRVKLLQNEDDDAVWISMSDIVDAII